jgi:hypothetical protein
MNQNTVAELLALVEAEEKEAGLRLEEAQKVEEDNDYSDAMESMERTYAEGYVDALAYVIDLLKGNN